MSETGIHARYPRRALHLAPSLFEFKSLTFEDFVRTKILGSELSKNNKNSCTDFPDKSRDGIAKVTLPEGWWDKKGIGGDTTGRGSIWQRGGKLGDRVIEGPIQQCPDGICGSYTFTMYVKPKQTVAHFRENADAYKERMLGEKKAREYAIQEDDEYYDELAKQYWRHLGPTQEPSHYGADMSGTLFDGDEASGWNPDKLDTCLQLLLADLDNGDDNETIAMPGVTSAYLYFGQFGAVFTAHTEDMNLLSINYLHAGEPKYWYSISPQDYERFESLAASYFPQAASNCKDFLRHKQFMLSPQILAKAGIPFKTAVQRPGDAIITLPNAYHFGINCGFNVAESSNFGCPEWLSSGRLASVCMCVPHSVRIDMDRFEMLLSDYHSTKTDSTKTEKKGADTDIIANYRSWARNQALLRREMLEEIGNGDGASNDGTLNNTAICHFGIIAGGKYKPNSKNVVLVSNASTPTRKKSAKSAKKDKTKNKKKRSKAENLPREEWRTGEHGTSKDYVNGTKVLAALDSEPDLSELDLDLDLEGDSGKNVSKAINIGTRMWFTGTVVDKKDGFVRIHFKGLKADEDVWVMIRGGDDLLMLDRGPFDMTKKAMKEFGLDNDMLSHDSGEVDDLPKNRQIKVVEVGGVLQLKEVTPKKRKRGDPSAPLPPLVKIPLNVRFNALAGVRKYKTGGSSRKDRSDRRTKRDKAKEENNGNGCENGNCDTSNKVSAYTAVVESKVDVVEVQDIANVEDNVKSDVVDEPKVDVVEANVGHVEDNVGVGVGVPSFSIATITAKAISPT